jgi:hypothetical protein
MSAKDLYHDVVKTALIKDGWTITHDPYTLSAGCTDVFVDLGAERILAAERNSDKIAVEVKSFRGPSEVRDLEIAIGQYVFYAVLARPGRTGTEAVSGCSAKRDGHDAGGADRAASVGRPGGCMDRLRP